jgi:hypothetical protein
MYENQMWRGTKEQYFELYNVASKHLKKCFPHLKIGGYGSCGFYAIADSFVSSAKSSPRMEYFIEFLDAFFKYIKENNCPLDFFSWHSYDTIENNKKYASYARRRLDEAGYTETETFCNEWNTEVKLGRTPYHASLCAGMLATFQNMPLDGAMFYDARWAITTYAGLFEPFHGDPTHAYYAFKEYNELYRLGTQCEVVYDENPVYAVAAMGDGRAAMLIANTAKEAVELVDSLPVQVRVCVDVNHFLQETAEDGVKALGERIITTHISDHDYLDEKHWLPMQGKIDWKKLLKAFDEIGYLGVFNYEVSQDFTPVEIKENYDTLFSDN